MEVATGRIERALLFLRAVVDQRTAIWVDRIAEQPVRRPFPSRPIIVEVADDFPAQHPKVVYVSANALGGEIRQDQMFEEGTEANHQGFAGW